MNVVKGGSKRLARFGLLVAAVFVLAACNTIPVATDYDPEWTLPSGASYAWVERKQGEASVDPFVDSDLVQARVQRAVDDQLRAQGLERVEDPAQAQLLVAYHVGEEEKIDVDTFHSWYGYYPCWGCFGYRSPYGYGFDPYGAGTEVWVREYTEGKLMIDLVEAENRKLVWRGVAERRMPTLRTPAEREAYIRETVSAIFERFPPAALR